MSNQPPNSNLEWQEWGERDPFFGVASWPSRARAGNRPWTDSEFYQLGKSDWEDFFSGWSQYGFRGGTCLEIGCGTGRITRQLVKTFEFVHATDVSEGMLRQARDKIPHDNIAFHLTDGVTLPLQENSVDAVFSTHVFQHFDNVGHASAYFEEVKRVLVPRGTMMIHLPLHVWPSMPHLFNALYKTRKRLGDVRAHIQRMLLKHGLGRPSMRGLSYPIDYLFQSLPALGFIDVQVLVLPVRSNGHPHPFVLARRGPRRI